MLEVARKPLSPDPLRAERYPELKVMLLSERVHDAEIRQAADELMAMEFDILLSTDSTAESAERQEALTPVMGHYPGLQRRIGARIRKLRGGP